MIVIVLLLFLWLPASARVDVSIGVPSAVVVGPEKVSEHHYVVELSDNISSNFMEYIPLLMRLAYFKDNDMITIYLRRNFGGSAATLEVLQRALHGTKAKVIFKVEGIAFSAAAIIISAGHEAHIYHNSLLLWHTGSVYGVRIRPGDEYYSMSYLFNYFAFNRSLICIRPGSCMYNPFERSLVSEGYWKNFLSGEDRFVSGEDVCENIGAKTHVDPENGLEYCKVRMLKGRIGERVEAI